MTNMIYTITLTEEEDLALSYVALNQQEWIDNAVHHRCQVAIDEIVDIAVKQCFANNIQVPQTKSDVVKLAFEQGWVRPSKEISDEMENTPFPPQPIVE